MAKKKNGETPEVETHVTCGTAHDPANPCPPSKDLITGEPDPEGHGFDQEILARIRTP